MGPKLEGILGEVREARGKVLVLTGAGISAESGIPTFRGKEGYWVVGSRNYSCYAGASAFLSTPSDLVRFAMAISSGTLLQPATVQTLKTSQRLTTGEETGYGLGWDLETAEIAGRSTRLAGHDGEILGGMVASLMSVPEYGLVVSVTSNISYADTHALAVKIAAAFPSAASGG